MRLADNALDPNVLTLGFARRFTAYKRPNLLLRDRARLERLLLDERHPIQIVLAGMAHPADPQGKTMIRDWIELASQPAFRRRVVFLEDYDMSLAQELVQGVDVWLNMPRRPWEACGTSGMKVLVNGGLNCSALDGWWDEAFQPDVGWAIGTRDGDPAADAHDAAAFYAVLEGSIVPEFYDRDAAGLPRAWLARIRRSMSTLTPPFSSVRMVREYVEKVYLPLAQSFHMRREADCALARELREWACALQLHWRSLHVGQPTFLRADKHWQLSVPVFAGEIRPDMIRVELYADRQDGQGAWVATLRRDHAIPGAVNGYIYCGEADADRPSSDFTVRIVPRHSAAFVPMELPLIAWQK